MQRLRRTRRIDVVVHGDAGQALGFGSFGVIISIVPSSSSGSSRAGAGLRITCVMLLRQAGGNHRLQRRLQLHQQGIGVDHFCW